MLVRFKLLAVAGAIAFSAGAFAADPIKIGVDGPFTGGSSSMGVSMRDGVRLAAEEINKSGGVLGRPILLVERDDEAKNERGVQIAQEFINKEKVVAVVGYINTGVALASQRFFQEAKIPVMNNVATGSIITRQFDKEPDNYVFRNAAHDSIQAPMIVQEAVTRRGYKKVAILADSTNYGQLGREDLEKALKAKGITPVAVEKFNIKDVDMTAQLLKAKEAGAEAVLTYGIGPELAQIANGMTKLGWKVPIIGSWTLSMANFIDNAGPGGDGARMPQTFIQEGTTPKRKEFIASYLKTFKPKNDRIDSPVSAAQGYDSIYLLAAAMKQANSTEGPKIKAALEDLQAPVAGVVTTYNKPFSKTDHDAITANIPVFGEVKGGRVVYANPDDMKNAAQVRVKDVAANDALLKQ
ncbi:ABC transporter substrate-binding protein [Variovorax sp. J22P168]|uniref:ABC transporter substrate-binding protein n=1 Tax=Variovorax jilinensis TaxID=3053513 RepID=UPI0025778EDB|nr:ABC transporter substrate-binding protein [Variovorax sp. J22P168]MDM0011863.1 ABC transporter substrate-binding protein [Variovorax sp. J22P168]